MRLVITLDVALFVLVASAALRHEPHSDVSALAPLVIAVVLLLSQHPRIHVLDRRESVYFSLLQLPVIAGVLVLSGMELLMIAVAVWLFALFVVGSDSWPKALFNLSNHLLNVATTIVVFDLFSPPAGFGWPTLLAAIAASCAGTLVATAMVLIIIAVSEQALDLPKSAETAAFAAALAAASATFTVPLVESIIRRTATTAMLAGLLPILLVTYQSMVERRNQRERLHFVAKLASPLTGGLLSAVSEVLLSETASTFRATYAELVLWHDEVGVIRVRHREGTTTTTYPDTEAVAGLKTALDALPLTSHHDGLDRSGPLGGWLAESSVEDALVGRLQWDSSNGAETKDSGVLIVADRVGPSRNFDAAELKLFSTLRFQVAGALEAERLGSALAQLKQHEQALSVELHHDALTGLPNRLHLSRHLDNLTVDPHGIELLFIDLDDFKLVNDALGHARGDELLVEVARRIKRCLGPDDFLARLGGDELAVSVRGTGQGAQLAGRIVDAVRQPLTLGVSTVTIGCSIGIATCRSVIDLETALERADIAMYAAKSQGKNGMVAYSDELGQELVELQQLLQQLRTALAAGDFLVHYQPIYSAEKGLQGRPCAAEALVRWASPDGLVAAGQFIPAAERSSLVVEIDRWVFRQVLADVDRLAHLEWVSVNLSARTLHRDDLVEWLVRTTKEAGVAPQKLLLEITETAAMFDVEDTIAKLQELRSLGFGVGLDDFGTGYSSIAYLRRLPVGLVKVDQSFIRDLDHTGDPALLKAIVTLAHTLHLPVVAEGVEEESQIATLQTAGCALLQGWFFGQPMPLAELVRVSSEYEAI